jgi:DNA-binding response OmpR family regulator
MSSVLVVEDEKHLAEGLRFNLEAEGYDVTVCESGEEALQRLIVDRQPFDVLVLDVMLPGQDGFAVIKELRQAGQLIPTLILTARGHSDDVLRGFGEGADDYLVKPFDLSILLARIHGLLRRRAWLLTAEEKAPPSSEAKDEYSFGETSVQFDLLELRSRGEVFRLTLMEANVLRYLIQHENEPVSRKTMLDEVWGLHEDTDTRPIDNFIMRLRRYIEADPQQPKHLLTVRGVGYRFVAHPTSL